jgi:hypothetical protein
MIVTRYFGATPQEAEAKAVAEENHAIRTAKPRSQQGREQGQPAAGGQGPDLGVSDPADVDEVRTQVDELRAQLRDLEDRQASAEHAARDRRQAHGDAGGCAQGSVARRAGTRRTGGSGSGPSNGPSPAAAVGGPPAPAGGP